MRWRGPRSVSLHRRRSLAEAIERTCARDRRTDAVTWRSPDQLPNLRVPVEVAFDGGPVLSDKALSTASASASARGLRRFPAVIFRVNRVSTRWPQLSTKLTCHPPTIHRTIHTEVHSLLN